MYNINDNVVALATAVGQSAINVIRCSGPDVLKITQKITNKKKPLKANFCFVSFIKNPQTQEIVDQCMVTPFLKPKSYTGQNMVEFSIHGGAGVYEKMIKLLGDEGCRLAEKGEFTYRAFINGKIDLIQAESIANIVNSNSALGIRYSLENLSGALSDTIETLCQQLKNIITYMEHELDFNEEEITYKTYDEYRGSLYQLVDETNKIINHSFIGDHKTGDMKVVICGATNAGKSSLFNYLAGYNRSIVTSVSGTTRDTVEVFLNINNINVSLVDTAGIRKTKDVVEIKGIERTHKTISGADIVLFVDEKDPVEAFRKLKLKIDLDRVVFVKNKIDLLKTKELDDVFYISCKKKVGGDKLLTHLSTLVEKHEKTFIKEFAFVASGRVMQILVLFIQKIKFSQKLFDQKEELAVIVSSLYDCLDLFTTTTSPSSKDDIINNIFKGFCVGK